VAGVYRTPVIAAEVCGVFTNMIPTAPYRGAGRPDATYLIERLIDVAARETGVDPVELRRRNLIPAEAMPFKTGLIFEYDCGDFRANMDAAASRADVAGFPARRAEAAKRGRLRGLGVCNPIEVAGGPFNRVLPDNARVVVSTDGTVHLYTGAMSVGQGLETAFAQIVSTRLGVPIERIFYHQGDTDNLATARGSGGSSGLCVSGSAVALAVDQTIEEGRRRAADHLETAAADIEFADGSFVVAGTDRRLSLVEVARLAVAEANLPQSEQGLSGKAVFQPPNVTFPNGCHICEVEVDPETGAVAVISYVSVEDIGNVVNPMLVHGQIHGGVAQGMGQALCERIVHDPDSAQLLTGSFMDYAMPRASDIPPITIEMRSVPTRVNTLGAKGVGEAGTVGAIAATMNAICDALAPLGIKHLDMPATPERIWAAIQAAKSAR
jgi:carbon-monoxide dehydrogenase large subunit